MRDQILCDGTQCFSVAVFEVVPCGRWRDRPIVKSCRPCSAGMVAAYKTSGGVSGWAELQPIKAVAK